jgi:hypothetical protein
VALVDPERDDAAPVDPSNPAAWELEGVDATTSAGEAAGRGPRAKGSEAPPASVSPAVWIEIDNSQCGQPSRLYIDGAAHGGIAAKRRVSVRTRSGPHELCVLPESDKRACGDQGTVRRAYLYEGWTLSVRCSGK